MQTLLKTKIGPFLVISSVLALWMLLAAQPVQAHSLTNPSCSRLPDNDFFDGEEIELNSATRATASPAATKPGTGETGAGSTRYHYAKITVPALTAGELTVSEGTGPSEAILCGRQEGSVSDLPSYTTSHNNAAQDADDATTAAMTADAAAAAARVADASVSTAKSALRNAEAALRNAEFDLSRAESALRSLESALRADGDTDGATAAEQAADAAESAATAADDAEQVADAAEKAATTASDAAPGLDAATTALDAATTALDAAATALDDDMGFDINALISSGDEEYVVVVTVPADADAPSLSVTFKGVMSTVALAPDGGSFVQDKQRDTHTLKTTTDTPGLLTVKTTGSAVDTVGTLAAGDATIAMDEDADSDGNFEIVSPVKADTDYSVHVDGQTRNESGDYGLKVEFRVADVLTLPTADNTPASVDRMLESGRADYLFFIADNHRFLTVETEKHMAVTTATNTTGTLFSTKGVVNTDTDSGFGTNFLIRAPVSPGDYIVEVKGSSSSTKGEYVLTTTSQAAAPPTTPTTGEIAGSTGTTAETVGARDVKPYSINVAKAGTLQLKTTGTADTYGVLYGPDGTQITADNDSGADMNFRITQAVNPGQHIVTVEGYKTEMVSYTLVVNFIEDVSVGTEDQVAQLTRENTLLETERDTARTERDDLQTRVTQLEEDTAPVEVDATGFLENPSGVRSGVGLISGWVCAANDVEIRISAGNSRVATLDAAYGTTRADTVDSCQHGEDDTGFGMTYNFNHLDEGMYTIEAYADGLTNRRIGSTLTFEVVHLMDFAAIDDDRFLRGLKGECRADDFPEMGDKTILEWEQSIQNFVISDVE